MQKDNMTNTENINLMDDQVISDPAMEAQIARGISDLLNNHTQNLKPEQERRLSLARNAAVNYLAEQQAQYSTANQVGGISNVLHWFGHLGQHFEQHRVASAALIMVVMLFTFFAVQQFGSNKHLENSDAFLLASDLPPEAYADKGFDAWIQSN
ncbi:MAG TPA: DUF3619 family protein [Methylotenera sp.]|nr:DUF3619 family protein [Methylotenera sp.]